MTSEQEGGAARKVDKEVRKKEKEVKGKERRAGRKGLLLQKKEAEVLQHSVNGKS